MTEAPNGTSLSQVFSWVLAIVIGGMGLLAANFPFEPWHFLVGTGLTLLACALLRRAKSAA